MTDTNSSIGNLVPKEKRKTFGDDVKVLLGLFIHIASTGIYRLYLCPRAKLPSQSVCNRLEALIYYPSELILAEAALVTLQNDYYQKAAITVLNNTISTGGIVNAGDQGELA
ncbi:2200_t:CDS:2 [Entrophospora sp. SA101]|nr:2200_t:CDS:2 [Entrophospora sp. SA101]